jgi:hypothetical protein
MHTRAAHALHKKIHQGCTKTVQGNKFVMHHRCTLATPDVHQGCTWVAQKAKLEQHQGSFNDRH